MERRQRIGEDREGKLAGGSDRRGTRLGRRRARRRGRAVDVVDGNAWDGPPATAEASGLAGLSPQAATNSIASTMIPTVVPRNFDADNPSITAISSYVPRERLVCVP